MKQDIESSDIIDGEDMNEDAPNPDLEWETTAIAEAKKKAEIKSNVPYSNPLLTHLYIDCKIIDRVVKAWEENEGEEPRRKGYMGHLTRIANTMVSYVILEPSLISSSVKSKSIPESVMYLDLPRNL